MPSARSWSEAISKIEFQPELHLALRLRRSGFAEVGVSERVADVGELRFVEDVERFCSKLEAFPLLDAKLLLQAEIDVVDTRIAQRSIACVAERIGSLSDEGRGVE